MSISRETRNRKAESYTEKGALERWINELAEESGKSKEEIAQLAIVRLEKERIENYERIQSRVS